MIGKTISHYKIIEKLGAGGMGVVYKAHDTKLDRTVALKFLPPHLTVSDIDKERFLQEAKAAAALNHPNVCVIHDIHEYENEQFIIMEYIDGKTLRKLLSDKRQLTIENAVEYAIQIGEALQEAHNKSIVHRDVKSDNIMITTSNQVKVMDFGLAKLKGSLKLTKSSSTVGTLVYMAPEQIQGEEVDARSDIFSFGVVLYEMLTGQCPFKGDYEASLIYSILNDEPEPIQKLVPNISSELLHIINRVLEKDPENRYQSMNDILIDLRRLKRDSDKISKSRLENISEIEEKEIDKKTKISQKPKLIIWFAIIFAVLILTVIAIYIIEPFSTTPRLPMKTIPFTSLPGLERCPAFSPDGKQIAYSWNSENEDNYDVYVKMIGVGGSHRLTTHPGVDIIPEWSPDGKYIAFARQYQDESNIYIIPALEGAERRLDSGKWQSIDNLSWSSDAKFIALSGKGVTDELISIYLLSVERLDLRKLTSPPKPSNGDFDCSFSPDGEMIAFNRDISFYTGDIFVVPVAGGEPIQLTFDNAWIRGLTWTQDGREIVFISNRGGNQSLWRISANGGNPKPLAVSSQNFRAPAISRKGNLLAYEELSFNYNIWRIEIPKSPGEVTIPKKLIFSTRPDYAPQFSADGKKIAFGSMRSGNFEIWTCDSNGQKPVQITSFSGPLVISPTWSPDGRLIAFRAHLNGPGDIYLINADGGLPRQITKKNSEDRYPCWSADGEWIFFESDRSGDFEIWKTPKSGGSFVQVTENGGYAPQTSSDGLWLYYSKQPQSEIWKISLEDGAESLVSSLPSGNYHDWSLADNGIYFFNEKDSLANIYFFDFKAHEISKIFDLDNNHISCLAVSQDGKLLLYEQRDQLETDIILVENFY